MNVPGRFLKSMLEPGEHGICQTRLHWIYMATGTFWFGVLAAMGWGADYVLWKYMGSYIPTYQFNTSLFEGGLKEGWIGWLLTSCGGIILIMEYLKYATTVIAVTSKRVMMKTGLLNVRVNGTDISDVRGVHVDQGWFGRFFNYGKITLDCRFVADIRLPYARAPYMVVRDIQKIKSELEELATPKISLQSTPQTVVQINTGPQKGVHSVVENPDDRIIVVNTIEDNSTNKQPAIEHRLHDEIIDDFKSKA